MLLKTCLTHGPWQPHMKTRIGSSNKNNVFLFVRFSELCGNGSSEGNLAGNSQVTVIQHYTLEMLQTSLDQSMQTQYTEGFANHSNTNSRSRAKERGKRWPQQQQQQQQQQRSTTTQEGRKVRPVAMTTINSNRPWIVMDDGTTGTLRVLFDAACL